MKDTLIALFVVDFLIVVMLYFFGETHWLVNSQVAFISSSIVMLSSMKSYKNMVDGRLNVGSIPDDERDTLDKLEDPYDLYDDEHKVEEEKTLVEVVKEERANLKKSRRSIWDTTKDAKPSFSFYRLAAYAVLIFGFFYLNTNKLLVIMPYLIFLSIPSIIIVIMLMKSVDKNR
jgi:hypothetical protein